MSDVKLIFTSNGSPVGKINSSLEAFDYCDHELPDSIQRFIISYYMENKILPKINMNVKINIGGNNNE